MTSALLVRACPALSSLSARGQQPCPHRAREIGSSLSPTRHPFPRALLAPERLVSASIPLLSFYHRRKATCSAIWCPLAPVSSAYGTLAPASMSLVKKRQIGGGCSTGACSPKPLLPPVQTPVDPPPPPALSAGGLAPPPPPPIGISPHAAATARRHHRRRR
jgi:hypothetical protein